MNIERKKSIKLRNIMKKKNIIIMSLIVVISIILLLLLKGCEKKYTVTFDTNGGTKIDSVKVTKNTKVDIPTKVEKEGYIFGGFTDEEGLLVTDNIEVTKNITLTARWISKESETINVTYIIDDNTKINVVLEKNSSIVKPRLKDRKGYIFGGYLVDGKILTDDKIDTDTDIKVIWIKDSEEVVTVTYIINDKEYKVTMKKGSKLILPNINVIDGYIFKGFKMVDDMVDEDTIIDKDATITLVLEGYYECPSDCVRNSDVKTCNKVEITSIVNSIGCPSGYHEYGGKCVGERYEATYDPTINSYKCKSSSHYRYTEEEAGGAFEWCEPLTDIVKTKTCPSGYTKENDICKKTTKISCKIKMSND